MLYVFGSCFFLCVLFYFVSRLFAKKVCVIENASTKILKCAEEEPMSNNNAPQIKYDVFVSFRGPDVRSEFLSHLMDAFERNHINAFADDNIEKGENIWPSLVGAIKGSSMSLIIFSSNYASSHWCLEELVEILECRKNYNQIVIPIFYKVEPRDVGHQSSKSYRRAFAEHKRNHETPKVQKWKESLKESAKMSGFVSSTYPNEVKLVDEIISRVNDGLEKSTKPRVNKRLVGIEEKVEVIESWISEEPNDTRLFGIWGMGGLGKTTLAEEVFNKIQSKYDGSYLLANESHRSSEGNRCNIISLKKEIFSELLGYGVKIQTLNSLPQDVVSKIGRKRVLIVLDDVNDYTHIGKLLGPLDNFGSGSIIIVTTRDEKVLKANKVYKTYRIEALSPSQALLLFNLNAFKQNDHQRNCNKPWVVNYAKGNPLVIKVLAGLLCGQTKEVWEAVLDQLQKEAPDEVYKVMKLSYDYLASEEKNIFLDLACFVFRVSKEVKVGYLKSLLTDERNNSVLRLESLKEKALITFSEDGFISMHDCLQEMGREIVRQYSGSRKWLWDPAYICEALENDKGNEAIRSLQINLAKITEQELSPDMFTKMKGLKFLEIYGYSDPHHILALGWPQLAKKVKLKFLSWEPYPLKSLPEEFFAEKLVILKLREGKMEKLWEGVKNLANLKVLDLSQSRMLKELPDLAKATNLEELVLSGCSELNSVHSSVFSLGKLEKLDLWECKSLTVLKSDSPVRSLSYLYLGGLYMNLREFSLTSKNMKYLRLGSTEFTVRSPSAHFKDNNIESFTSSFHNFTQLLHLEVTNCRKLKKWQDLPPFLETLGIKYCNALQRLPELPPTLKTLDVSCNSLESVPKLPPSLKTLDWSCKSLQSVPELPPTLERLYVRFCKSLSLPELPPTLKKLYVESCKSLQSVPELPPSLEYLNVLYNDSLENLPELPPSFKMLEVRECLSLKSLPKLPLFLKTLWVRSCDSLGSLPELPQSLEILDVLSCDSLGSLQELPPSLKTLEVGRCLSLQSLPELPRSLETLAVWDLSLKILPELPMSLETLKVGLCKSLKSLPELPSSLKNLDVWNCDSLESVPKLPPSLKAYYVHSCKSLQSVPLLPPSLKTPVKTMKTRCEVLEALGNKPRSTPMSTCICSRSFGTGFKTCHKNLKRFGDSPMCTSYIADSIQRTKLNCCDSKHRFHFL